MGAQAKEFTTTTNITHVQCPLPRTVFNRVFAAVYALAILALLYHHAKTLLCSTTTLLSFSLSLVLFIADLVLVFQWFTAQALRMCPIYRKEFPENLEKVMKRSEYPALDVFICTADPYKEPPCTVVNTALSVMAYDYPTEKISVYVSDDGGSALTLFAFMEAAKFAAHWLPFCRENNIVQRSPNEYFESNYPSSSEIERIKMMYESMKARVEHVVNIGKVGDEFITTDKERETFNKWTENFTRQEHPTVIEVLQECGRDKDITGHSMPNLIYVSREKSKIFHHRFKAGALNVLVYANMHHMYTSELSLTGFSNALVYYILKLRVSAIITNAPMILTLDCDMFSNDPQTAIRALCYYSDPDIRSKFGYIQFPQRFRGINKNDIYAGEVKRIFQITPMGFDGLMGANHVGTGCFFFRRVFYGGPSSFVPPELPELDPNHAVHKPIQSPKKLALGYQVASCNYENQTSWGSKIGYRYGSLIEDFYSGFRLQCEGWRSIFCNPERAAFLGDAPISLVDLLNQQKRWAIGFLDIAFSKQFSPMTFGIRSKGILTGLAYAHNSFNPVWSIPLTIYAFLPQLALLNNITIFPRVTEPWFLLYAFLFLGAYGQDMFEFLSSNGTVLMWWNDQRIWNIRGVSCYLFGTIEFFLQCLGISSFGFNVTSKAVGNEQSKRYEQGIFDFGVHSHLFVTLSMAALTNLASFVSGLIQAFKGRELEGLVIQIFIAAFAIVNSWPIYEAMFLRSDKGKMPAKTTITAAFLSLALCMTASFCSHGVFVAV